jgi:phosphoribosylformylglycinamidine cyclo-ligase
MIAIVRRDAVQQVADVLAQAGERVSLLGDVIVAGDEGRVIYDGHLDLAM